MVKIVIEDLSDETDCDTCGSNYEEGFKVTIDGKSFGDYEPNAGCTSLIGYSLDEVYRDILTHLGHTIERKY